MRYRVISERMQWRPLDIETIETLIHLGLLSDCAYAFEESYPLVHFRMTWSIWASLRETLSWGFATSVDTNWPVQPQKLGWGLKTRGIVLSRQRTTKALIRLRKCACWSRIWHKQVFSWRGSVMESNLLWLFYFKISTKRKFNLIPGASFWTIHYLFLMHLREENWQYLIYNEHENAEDICNTRF